MKRLVALIGVIALAATGLSACNTVHGIGQDVQKAGEAISGASKK